MSSTLLAEPVALDTNIYVFGIRGSEDYPAASLLPRQYLPVLAVYLPLQVIREVNSNLFIEEERAVYRLLGRARHLVRDFAAADPELIARYAARGAKDGDASICANLHRAAVRWLVSQNRDFLHEFPNLPFSVIDAQEAVELIGAEATEYR